MSEHPSANKVIVDKVMAAIEECYFEDGPDSAEAIFKDFATKNHHAFSEDIDAHASEQKLEWTPIYQEFQKLYEKTIEGKTRIY